MRGKKLLGNKSKIEFCLALCLSLLVVSPVFSNSVEEKSKNIKSSTETVAPEHHHDHEKMLKDQEKLNKKPTREEIATSVGLDEQINNFLPLDLEFTDENGKVWKLKEIIDRPTLLLPVFYSCSGSCSVMNAELAHTLKKLGMPKGEEAYRAISLSFDDEETQKMAKETKNNFTASISEHFPVNEWFFLFGSSENIEKLLKAIGYRKLKLGTHDYVHPNVMVTIAGDGKIIRYLHGPDFLPSDVQMSLGEALQGRATLSIRKLISYCFNYDSKGKKYVLNITRIFATVSIIMVICIYVFLLRKKRVKVQGDK